MTIPENLYYGNIHPSERIVKGESEYGKLGKRLLECEHRLPETFDATQKQTYEVIMHALYEQMDISAKESFIEGFCLGATVMQEIVTEPESQFAPLHPMV